MFCFHFYHLEGRVSKWESGSGGIFQPWILTLNVCNSQAWVRQKQGDGIRVFYGGMSSNHSSYHPGCTSRKLYQKQRSQNLTITISGIRSRHCKQQLPVLCHNTYTYMLFEKVSIISFICFTESLNLLQNISLSSVVEFHCLSIVLYLLILFKWGGRHVLDQPPFSAGNRWLAHSDCIIEEGLLRNFKTCWTGLGETNKGCWSISRLATAGSHYQSLPIPHPTCDLESCSQWEEGCFRKLYFR